MVNMVASKRVKYPHGPTGREYAPGEVFEALSDRDAKGLYISGKARYGEKVLPKNPTDLPPAPEQQKTLLPEIADDPNADSRRGQYQRRDMVAEPSGQTGEAKPLQSSPPVQAPKGRRSNRSRGGSKS